MSLRLSHEFTRRVAAAGCVTAIALAAGAPHVGAASPDFGTPSAVSTFGTGISFTQPYGGPAFASAEIVLTLPFSDAPEITQLPEQTGATLGYELDASQGQLLPNQKITATFEVTLSDGTVEVGPPISATYADDRFQWKTVTAGVVTVHFYSGSSSFVQQFGSLAQQGITKSAAFLGVKETQPIDYFIYADQQSFLDAMGPATTGDVGGQAFSEFRTCFAQINDGDLGYARSVIPHELTHIVFADAIANPYHDPLNWFNEGMAVYLSDGYTTDNRQRVSRAAVNGALMPLVALTGAFPRITDRFYLAYAEAVSAVDFFVRKYGQADVAKLLISYRTGATDDEAFKAAIGVDTVAFDKAWLADNAVESYQPFGPQPAPSGPLPPGWGSSAGGNSPGGSGVAGIATPGSGGTGQQAGARAKRNPTFEALGTAGVLSTIALVLLIAAVIIHRKNERGAP